MVSLKYIVCSELGSQCMDFVKVHNIFSWLGFIDQQWSSKYYFVWQKEKCVSKKKQQYLIFVYFKKMHRAYAFNDPLSVTQACIKLLKCRYKPTEQISQSLFKLFTRFRYAQDMHIEWLGYSYRINGKQIVLTRRSLMSVQQCLVPPVASSEMTLFSETNSATLFIS